MKTNTEPTAIEKLKEANICPGCDGSGVTHYGGTEFEEPGYEDCHVCNGTGNLIDPAIINKALSEAERKIFEDCLLKFWSVLPDDPQMIELLKRYQSKHGAKI